MRTETLCNYGELAKQHVQQLCYPRRVGTEGERRAADYIEAQMRQAGLQVRREIFPVFASFREWQHRLLFAGCAILAVVGALALDIYPLVSLLAWASVAMLVNQPWRLTTPSSRSNLPTSTWSENVLGYLRNRSTATVRVVFMAHYDTKSQVLPTGLRVALVTSVWICAWALVGLTAWWLSPLWPSWLPETPNPWILTVIIVVCLAGLAANYTGNRSPGALDNASGVGALLALAQLWQQQIRLEHPSLRQVEAIWVATSAEETDLDGARHFLAHHFNWLNEVPTLLINLESVGAGSRCYLSGAPATLDWAEKRARELGMHPSRLHVLGAGMDHQPFAGRKLPSLSILGDVVGYSFYLHTLRDDLRLIEMDALERTIRLACHLAASWAEEHAAVPVRTVSARVEQSVAIPAVRHA
jgi:hypothetical protein